jgi:16S rRNA G966 N2-methylase RsmD
LNRDWSKVITPAVTTRHGMTGVFLDPPYTHDSGREHGLYATDDLNIGHRVRDWAVENGENPLLRIALCGYDGEYRIPSNWSVFDWKGAGSRNGHRERIWFSPHCLP